VPLPLKVHVGWLTLPPLRLSEARVQALFDGNALASLVVDQFHLVVEVIGSWAHDRCWLPGRVVQSDQIAPLWLFLGRSEAGDLWGFVRSRGGVPRDPVISGLIVESPFPGRHSVEPPAEPLAGELLSTGWGLEVIWRTTPSIV
jgi:hypothetical protein